VRSLATPVDSRAGSVAERVRAMSASLAPGEARVAAVLLAEGADVIHLTVSEAADAAGVGVGTVVRACQRLGFHAFQDAKIALGRDLQPLSLPTRSDIEPSDCPSEVLEKLTVGSDEAVRRVPASVDPEALQRAVTLLCRARRVLFLGVGTSSPLAQDAAYRLSTIGVGAEAPADVHVQHVRARLLGEGDAAIAISHTGATRETVAAAYGAKQAGADLVAITSFAHTPLTQVCDVVLVAGSSETRVRVEAMTSRLAHLLVLDALYVSVLIADAERAVGFQELTAEVLAEHRF
jgi:RpiR family transcriptional regulator, carbohydrate utilization regulator